MNGQAIIAHLGDLPWPKALIYGMVAAAAYYFLVFNDGSALQQQLEGATTELTTAKRGLEQTKKAIADADKFEKEVTNLALEFKKIRDFMPDNLGPSVLTEIVSQQASLASAVVSKMEPVMVTSPLAVDDADFYESSKMALAIEGSYAQLAKFFSNLTKLPRILTFEDVKISQLTGGDNEHPRLGMTGILVGYRYKNAKAPDHEEKPATPPADGSAPAADGAAPAAGGGDAK